MKQCPNCGQTYQDKLQFCPADGIKLVVAQNHQGIHPGQILADRYEIICELDKGGLWHIYQGREVSNGQRLAIKVISLKDQLVEGYQEELQKRVRALKSFPHPALIKIYDYGICSHDFFYVISEYVEGENLKKLIKDVGTLSLSLSLSILEQSLRALQFLHSQGMLHLDFRPAKLFVMKSANTPYFIKIDGIGRFAPFAAPDMVVADAQLQSTRQATSYTAPELFFGRKPGTQSDVYSLGVIAYEMLTGILPFPPGALMYQKSAPTAAPIHRIRPATKISRQVEKAILKAIHWESQRRFANADKFLAALESAQQRWSYKYVALILFLLCGMFYVVSTFSSSIDSWWQQAKDYLFAIEKKTTAVPVPEKTVEAPPFSMDDFNAKCQAMRQKGSQRPATDPYQNMCWIPPGETLVGNRNGDFDEQPARPVSLAGFYIDRTEVTNADYQLFVNITGQKAPEYWKNGKYPQGKSQLPVVKVSWYDANLYAAWRGKRLPLESEWEMAAHGQGKRQKNLQWPWGDVFFPSFANVSGQTSVPVGHFPQGKSVFGVLDMAGNVWEWTNSWYDVEIKKDRVIKGGSYRSVPFQARTTYRDGFSPEYGREDIGFRCVKEKK